MYFQAWVTDGDRERLIVGCVSGEVLVVEALDLKAVLRTEGAAAADCILPFSKGFLVGQSNGAVAVFERDDRDSYLRSKVCACVQERMKLENCDCTSLCTQSIPPRPVVPPNCPVSISNDKHHIHVNFSAACRCR
jgi:hypothetical protein